MVLNLAVLAAVLTAGPPAVPSLAHNPVPVAATLSGRVTTTDGLGLPDVRVEVAEIQRSGSTDAEGRYRLPQLPTGTYSVTFARIGFAPQVRRVTIANQDITVDVQLMQSAIELQAIQITATPLATTALTSPQTLTVVGGEELRSNVRASLGETLEGQVGLRNLSTGTGIGKPVIRGLTSNRVLILADGQRLENSQFGDEHGPQVETADAERIEVIRGPASVLYGSDALGGVINVVPRPLPDAGEGRGFVRAGLSGAFSSNNTQPEGSALLEGASSRGFGFRTTFSGRNGGDIRTPIGRLANSGNEAYDGSVALGTRGGWGSLTGAYTHREERVEIHEDPGEEPDFSGFQRIGDDRAKVSLSLPTGGASRLEADVGFERNRRREFEEAGTDEVALGLLSRTWTADLHLHHAVGKLAGILGVSGLRTSLEKFGEETLIPESSLNNGGVYVFEQSELGRWNLSFGVRYDYRRLAVGDDAELGVTAQTRDWHSLIGNVGALFHVTEPVALVLNVGRGFRAPSSFDLFANGVHEGTVAFERGNPDLRNEKSLNSDLALRIQSSRVRLEVGGFVNLIEDYIYSRPTGTFDPESGFEIFDVVQGDARLAGFEAAAELHATGGLHLRTGLDYVNGQNTSTDTPLPFIPPFRWTWSARLEGRESEGAISRPWLIVGSETNARQGRIDPTEFAPEGYSLFNAGLGADLRLGARPVTVEVSVRNLFDKEYAALLSRYKRYALNPGRNLMIRASIGM
jgi:iron complex outermembrane receptor protein